MPLCAEHGQVYGEGSACATCEGKELHHEGENVPVVMSTTDKNVFQQALEDLAARVDALEEQAGKPSKRKKSDD